MNRVQKTRQIQDAGSRPRCGIPRQVPCPGKDCLPFLGARSRATSRKLAAFGHREVPRLPFFLGSLDSIPRIPGASPHKKLSDADKSYAGLLRESAEYYRDNLGKTV